MVWGMALPSGFGDFFPGGNYVGWEEELTQYFREKMPAEQKALFADDVSSYRYYVAENFINEPGVKLNSDLPPFGPIAAHEAPKCFETEKRYSSLGSLIELSDRIVAVGYGDMIPITLNSGASSFPLSSLPAISPMSRDAGRRFRPSP